MRVYISSPVGDYQKQWNLDVTRVLRESKYEVLLPQEITPTNKKHENFPLLAYSKCVEWINASDFGMLLLPYGRDCAWEVGYYRGLDKPLFVFVNHLNEANKGILRDWMIKGSVYEVIISDDRAYQTLLHDPIISPDILTKINTLDELPETCKNLMQKYLEIDTPILGAGAVITKGNEVLLVKEKKTSDKYNKKSGMWGFPTRKIIGNTPASQAIESLSKESNVSAQIDYFIGTEQIPNAVGFFYKAKPINISNAKGKWFSIDDVVNERIYLRPTYSNVMKKVLKREAQA